MLPYKITRCSLFLTAIMIQVHARSETPSSPPSSFSCGLDNKVTVIDVKEHPSGVIETPGFPDKFPLPLKCGWIFDKSGLLEDERTSGQKNWIHLYFTQYHLRPGFLHLSVNATQAAVESWRQAGNVSAPVSASAGGEIAPGVWQGESYANSSDALLVARLDIPNEDYNRLHMRAIDVYNSYGFRIAYEVKTGPRRTDQCSLLECNMNGECLTHFTRDGRNISHFSCECALPNRAHLVEKRFNGARCEHNAVLGECDDKNEREVCSGRGKCRFISNRWVACDCDEGFAGGRCERNIRRSDDPNSNTIPASTKQCKEDYVVLDVTRNLPEIRDYILANFLRISEIDRVEETHNVRVYERRKSRKEAGRLLDYGTLYLYPVNKSQLATLNRTLNNFVLNETFRQWLMKARIGTAVRDVVTRLEPSGLCAQGLVVKPGGLIMRGGQFHLSCSVAGAVDPKFIWYKDGRYLINATMASRFMKPYVRVVDSATVGVLVVQEAGEWDNGKFFCRVEDRELSRLLRVDKQEGKRARIPFRSSVTTSLDVFVATEPKIEVFPRTLTVIRNNELPKAPVSHTLHCLAAKELPWDYVGNYTFDWRKNGGPIDKDDIVEEVFMPTAAGVFVKFGLILKLGAIGESAVYSCVVIDRRSLTKTINARDHDVPKKVVDVKVYLAERKLDVCDEQVEHGGMFWPQTMKGVEAIRPCPEEQEGFIRRKCEKTNNRTRGYWPSHSNPENCVQREIFLTRDKINAFMNGFLLPLKNGFLPERPERLPANFLEFLPENTDPRMLYKSEWRIVMNLAKKVIEFFGKKPFFDPRKLPEKFFETFVPWLTDSTRPLERGSRRQRARTGPTPTAELFSLIRSAAALFASDMEIGSELALTGHGEPHGGCDQSTLAVSMARMKSGPVLSEGGRHDSPRSLNVSSACVNLQATVEVNPGEGESFGVSAIYYRPLDDAVRSTCVLDLGNGRSRHLERNSSIITVLVEPVTKKDRRTYLRSAPVPVDFTIRFSEVRFIKNSSEWRNLSCARLDLDATSECKWDDEGAGCSELQWDGSGGLVCKCNRSGSYALIWSREIEQPTWTFSEDTLAVTLGSGCCLIVSLLTMTIILWQLCNNRGKSSVRATPVSFNESIAAFQCFVAATVVAVQALILFAALDTTHKIWWTPLLLQYLMLLMLLMQLCLLISMNCKVENCSKSKAKMLERLSFGLSLVVPGVHCFIAYMLEPMRVRLARLTFLSSAAPTIAGGHDHAWFVDVSSADFPILVTSATLSLVAYFVTYAVVRRRLQNLTRPKLEQLFGRESILQRCGTVFTASVIFIAACLLHENLPAENLAAKCAFAVTSVALGVAIFLGYLVSSEGYIAQTRTFVDNFRWSCKPATTGSFDVNGGSSGNGGRSRSASFIRVIGARGRRDTNASSTHSQASDQNHPENNPLLAKKTPVRFVSMSDRRLEVKRNAEGSRNMMQSNSLIDSALHRTLTPTSLQNHLNPSVIAGTNSIKVHTNTYGNVPTATLPKSRMELLDEAGLQRGNTMRGKAGSAGSASSTRSGTTTATASTCEEDCVDAYAPSGSPEAIYVAMNNNNSETDGVVNREGVEKYPHPAPKEVGGLDEIYAAPHIYSSDGKYSFDYTRSLLRSSRGRMKSRKTSTGDSGPPSEPDCTDDHGQSTTPHNSSANNNGEGYVYHVPSAAEASKRYARPIHNVSSLPFIPNPSYCDSCH